MSVVIFHRFWHPKSFKDSTHLLSTALYAWNIVKNISYMSVAVCAANLTRSVLGYRNHRVGVGRFKIVVDLRADTNNNNAHTIGVAVTIGIQCGSQILWLKYRSYSTIQNGQIRQEKDCKWQV